MYQVISKLVEENIEKTSLIKKVKFSQNGFKEIEGIFLKTTDWEDKEFKLIFPKTHEEVFKIGLDLNNCLVEGLHSKQLAKYAGIAHLAIVIDLATNKPYSCAYFLWTSKYDNLLSENETSGHYKLMEYKGYHNQDTGLFERTLQFLMNDKCVIENNRIVGHKNIKPQFNTYANFLLKEGG